MTPLERVARERAFLLRRTQESRRVIGLHVSSSGVSFEIADPSTGEILLRTVPAVTRKITDFQLALDHALIQAAS